MYTIQTKSVRHHLTCVQSEFRHAALIAHASVLAAMLCMLLFTAFGSVQAQENKKIPRVGFLSATGESDRVIK